MEIIFSEWLGINRIEKINEDRIIEYNEKYWFEKWDKEIEKKQRQTYYQCFIFDIHDSKRNSQEINAIEKINKQFIRSKGSDKNLEVEIKEAIKVEIKRRVQQWNKKFGLDAFDFEVLDQINATHQANLKKQGSHNPNPICKIFKYNGEYCVETYQYVAEFELPLKGPKLKKNGVLKIKILPRDLVSEEGFARMIGSIFNISSLGKISGVRSANSFLILYYMAFLSRMKEVLKRGVYREYVEMEENLNFLKERLLIPEQVRLNHINKHKLYCGFTEFSPDNIINQTIISTLNLISNSKFSGNNYLTSSVRNIQNTFGDVEIAKGFKPSVYAIDKIRYNRQNKRYEEIMCYCRNIIQNLGGAFGNDSIKYTAFYLDMNELFEQYVGKKLQEKKFEDFGWNKDFKWAETDTADSDWSVILQHDREYLDETKKMFKVKPDILINDRENKPIAVADTKYKRLIDDVKINFNILSSDIYQVIAYAEKFGVKNMYLIYPKPTKEWSKDLSFEFGKDERKKLLIIKTVDLQTLK